MECRTDRAVFLEKMGKRKGVYHFLTHGSIGKVCARPERGSAAEYKYEIIEVSYGTVYYKRRQSTGG